MSELVGANVEDFFVNDGVRYWRIFGKGGRTRDVPLPGEVARVLDVYLAEGRRVPEGSGEQALLVSWRGRRLMTRMCGCEALAPCDHELGPN